MQQIIAKATRGIIMMVMTENSLLKTLLDQTLAQSPDNNLIKWATIVIPSVVTILGFIITNRNTKRGFEETLKQKNNDQKREVYTAAYNDIEELLTNSIVIFDMDLFDKIESHKASIKLCGSIAVIQCYEDIYKFCLETITPYRLWIMENHPKNQYETIDDYIYDPEREKEDRLFEEKKDQYRKSHLPDNDVLVEMGNALLNKMRNDLGNDTIHN